MNDTMLETMKLKMIQTLQTITHENYDQSKDYIHEQFKTMDSLNNLYKYEQNHLPPQPKPVTEQPVPENNNDGNHQIEEKLDETPVQMVQPDETKTFLHPDNALPFVPESVLPTESDDNDATEKSYTFERMLRGGMLPKIEAFVPESIVRNLDIEHGDLLTAEKIKNAYGKYIYSVAERRNEPERKDREQFNLCQVERDGDMFCVTRSLETGNTIRIDDSPQKIIISDKDMMKYDLNEGDIVDVAFYIDKAHDAKVIWRHGSTSIAIADVAPKTDPAKKKATKPTEPSDKTESERPLDGVKVCIVGESHKKQLYDYAIKQAGGELLMTDGKNKNMQIRAQVKRSDIVACLIGNTSHIGMETAKDQAKESNVHFLPLWTLSANTIVKSIAEHLEKVKLN